jgi:hypothetical protein
VSTYGGPQFSLTPSPIPRRASGAKRLSLKAATAATGAPTATLATQTTPLKIM